MVSPKYHIFICNSCKIKGEPKGFCNQKGSPTLLQKLIEEIDDRELSSDCLVTATSCFQICDKGPIAVVYPEGVWYGNLDEKAVEEICERHLEGGTPVEELMLTRS
ncbi:MAG: (2Fe-2S) ferredoxin domain-containing protein [Clostridiales Family XIII bacterium]|jgi:(2Fe-2S) ferredoxin|nr:(2Fe-2S) ferredoxin domain-containing protein [Clostridiales Family XIII bacterium]